MFHATDESGKQVSKVLVSQVSRTGEAQFYADLSKTILEPKIQINWSNTDKVMTLCAKWHYKG